MTMLMRSHTKNRGCHGLLLGRLGAGMGLVLNLAMAEPAAHWPQFRGPAGSGLASGRFPVHFGPQSNLLWSVPVPSGHSSPSLWGDRIYLTGFADNQLLAFCVDRRSGTELWRRALPPQTMEGGARLSNPATATPVTDGELVWAYFGTFGLVCYDVSGQELWRKPLPVPITQHGAGTSPVLAGHRLILNCDQDVGSYLLAVDKRTGETLWKTERPGFRRGFATPLPYPAQAPRQVIVAGTLRLVAYDLENGREQWSVRGLPNEMVSSAVAGDGLIFVAGWTHGSGVRRMPPFGPLLEQGDADQDGQLTRQEAPPGPARQHFQYIDADKDGRLTREEYESIAQIFDESQNQALAVRPDGHGDVTDSHLVWRFTRGLPYVPSPLFYEGHVYLLKNGGMMTCLDAQSGQDLYREERLGALGDYYASPIAADGKVLVISQPGVAVVLRAGAALEVLARNELGEEVLASPALVENTLYIRGSQHLFAFTENIPGN